MKAAKENIFGVSAQRIVVVVPELEYGSQSTRITTAGNKRLVTKRPRNVTLRIANTISLKL